MGKRAFTIIELMVTVFIIALLLTAAASGIIRARKAGRDGQRIRDTLAIATAIDQYSTSARGTYPVNATNTLTSTMCADQIATTSPTDPSVKINIGLFLSRGIPKDPLPERITTNCLNYRDGYVYNNRMGSGTQLTSPNSGQNYEYVLELGLESDRPADEQTLKPGTDASSSVRHQYFIYGKPCTGDVPGKNGTCSIATVGLP